jgi:Tfp pilus assembly protein PilN
VLRGNLATRPFYNERLVRVVLIAALASAAAWAAVNIATVVSLSKQGAMLAERVSSEGRAATAARAETQTLRASLDPAEIATASRAATEANLLIAQRTFSWTMLFNRVEATLPAEVRLTHVQPQSDDDGRMIVSLSVVSRRIEDLDAFIGRLEATGAFRGVLSRSDAVLEDGSIESSLQGYYLQAANPVPPSSDPKGPPLPPGSAEGSR